MNMHFFRCLLIGVGNPLTLLDQSNHLWGMPGLGTLTQEALEVLGSHAFPFGLGKKVWDGPRDRISVIAGKPAASSGSKQQRISHFLSAEIYSGQTAWYQSQGARVFCCRGHSSLCPCLFCPIWGSRESLNDLCLKYTQREQTAVSPKLCTGFR